MRDAWPLPHVHHGSVQSLRTIIYLVFSPAIGGTQREAWGSLGGTWCEDHVELLALRRSRRLHEHPILRMTPPFLIPFLPSCLPACLSTFLNSLPSR